MLQSRMNLECYSKNQMNKLYILYRIAYLWTKQHCLKTKNRLGLGSSAIRANHQRWCLQPFRCRWDLEMSSWMTLCCFKASPGRASSRKGVPLCLPFFRKDYSNWLYSLSVLFSERPQSTRSHESCQSDPNCSADRLFMFLSPCWAHLGAVFWWESETASDLHMVSSRLVSSLRPKMCQWTADAVHIRFPWLFIMRKPGFAIKPM